MPVFDERIVGNCKKCRNKLFLNKDGLCIHCELDAEREKINTLECQIAQLKREKRNLYNTLIEERTKNMERRQC